MSDGRVGEEVSRISGRGEETSLASAGGGDMDACSCERMEGGEVLE